MSGSNSNARFRLEMGAFSMEELKKEVLLKKPRLRAGGLSVSFCECFQCFFVVLRLENKGHIPFRGTFVQIVDVDPGKGDLLGGVIQFAHFVRHFQAF
jgi:hypothetical protein